jgi:transcriptional regulator with XRE-family HTH domain
MRCSVLFAILSVRRLWMISPHVRKLRLAAELRALRTAAGLTHEQLAKRIGESRAQISRLENGHIVDQADVMKILDALGVTGKRWTQMMTITREAGEKGWWESTRGMGDRQALYANLEAGARVIREYQQTFLPGLLQTPEFVKARSDAENTLGPPAFTVAGVLAGNAGRQRNLRRPGAPTYEVIVDEVAVRRLSAPPDIVKAQLYHLATVCNNAEPAVTLRVLPVDARIESYTVPRCAFSMYTYPDPGDPAVVAIDTVTTDVIVTEPAEVAPYDQLYTRLRDVTMSPADSLQLLTDAATKLSRSDHQPRNPRSRRNDPS